MARRSSSSPRGCVPDDARGCRQSETRSLRKKYMSGAEERGRTHEHYESGRGTPRQQQRKSIYGFEAQLVFKKRVPERAYFFLLQVYDSGITEVFCTCVCYMYLRCALALRMACVASACHPQLRRRKAC